jgi:hypothetical protein
MFEDPRVMLQVQDNYLPPERRFGATQGNTLQVVIENVSLPAKKSVI